MRADKFFSFLMVLSLLPLSLSALEGNAPIANQSDATETRNSSQIFSPPQLDYASLCPKEASYDSAKNKPDSALKPAEKIRRAKLLIRGTADILPDSKRAANLLEAAIKTGGATQKASAQLVLGKLYAAGDGVTQDEALAEKLWQEAATINPYHNMMELAAAAERAGNYSLATQYYQKAAAAGNPKAYMVLATYYRDNKIAAPSVKAADEMITLAQNLTLQALSSGNCGALRDMATLFYNNDYGMRDDAVAMEWFKAGAETKDIYSMLMLADGYDSGYRIGYNLAKAIELWRSAAEMGNATAMAKLGKTLLLKHKTATESEAIIWLSQAGQRGNRQAIDLLVSFYQGKYGNQVDAAKAVEWLKISAEQQKKSPKHLRQLADALATGEGVAKDAKAAINYYRRAAELGNIISLVKLGDAYKHGKGVAANPVQSYRFYRQAAAEGDVEAMVNLVENYRCGVGKTADPVKAQKWYQRAIYENSREILTEEIDRLFASKEPADHHQAILLLSRWIKKEAKSQNTAGHKQDRTPMIGMAIAYNKGIGLKTDEIMAQRWIVLATAQGNGRDTGLTAYGKALLDKTKLGYYPQKAVQAFRLAETEGYDQAAYQLGKIYELGLDGISPSPSEAMRHYRIAGEQKHATAERRLGLLLLSTEAKSEGAAWLQNAAEDGDINAMLYLAGVAADNDNIAEAALWLEKAENHHPCTPDARAKLAKMRERIKGSDSIEKMLAAAEKGSPQAMRKLATYYLYQGNSEQSISWYEKAANTGDSQAMLELGNAYYTGAGVEASLSFAKEWWEKSAKAGNEEAKALLSQMP